MTSSPIRAVVFDAAGTLIHPSPPVWEAYYAAGRRHGSAKTVEQIAASFPSIFAKESSGHLATSAAVEHERWRRIVASVFDDVADIDELFADLWRHFAEPSSWSLFDDAADVWQTLSRRGVLLAVASNFDDRLRPILKQLWPVSQCEHINWSSEIGWAKPDRKFFETVERRLNLRPREILMVGDDEVNDHHGAKNAGWRSLLLRRKRTESSSPEVIASLAEVPQRIEETF